MDVLQHRQFETFSIPTAVFLNYVPPSSDFSVFLPVSPFFNFAPHQAKTASSHRLFYRLLLKNLPHNFRYAVEENFRSAEQIGQLTISLFCLPTARCIVLTVTASSHLPPNKALLPKAGKTASVFCRRQRISHAERREERLHTLVLVFRMIYLPQRIDTRADKKPVYKGRD